MTEDHTFRSRKFLFAVFFTVMGVILLMTGKLEGSEFVTLAGLILGLYAVGSVGDKLAKGKG